MFPVFPCRKCNMKLFFLIGTFYVVNNLHNAVAVGDQRIDPLVRITQGLVQGRKATDGAYSYFLGIPYAQVDLDNPFGPAQPHPGFEDEIFKAYDGSIRCPQSRIQPFAPKIMTNGEETLDCLRLNIYVPDVSSSSNPLPVLVWIHGGVFASGYAGEYNPRNLMKHGIIVVTINYRLGPYGFMCLDVPSVPGNQGLKDQHEALLWIRENIAAFGGNPFNVTLSGQSAGSGSVLLQLYSSREKIFDKVIAESGSPQNDGMFVEGNVDAALKIAQHLGFNTSNTEEALGFLANTSPDLVTTAAYEINLELRPCKERSFSGVEIFIESDLFTLSNERKIRNTPILIGHTNKEHVNDLRENYFKIDPFYAILREKFNFDYEILVKAASTVRHFYIGDEPINTDVTSAIEDFVSDFVVNHPTRKTITNLLNENANPVYQYLFSYVGDSTAAGAGHSAELKYLFEMTTTDQETYEGDQLITDRMTTLWSNFVKFGNPIPSATNLLPVIWEPATTNTRPYMVIDTDMRLEHFVYKERTSLWDLFYSVYGSYHHLVRDSE